MPLLSVVVPCYNHGRFLEEAVDSVLEQTVDDLEVVVVDDGSTEPFTRSLLDRFERPRARVLRTPNRGKAAACNAGIAETRGRYLLVLDADDRIAPTYAEQAIAVLTENPGVGIVYCEAEYFGKRTGPWELPPYSLEEMLRGNIIFSAGFFRREDWETVGGFCETVLLEDYDFWLSLIGLGRGVHRIPEVLFYHRRHWVRGRHKSRRLSRVEQAEDHDRIYRRHRALFADHVDVLFERILLLKREIAAQRDGRPVKRLERALRRLLGKP
jgi:glycosyltransferase involved in cell wall biosynthesis